MSKFLATVALGAVLVAFTNTANAGQICVPGCISTAAYAAIQKVHGRPDCFWFASTEGGKKSTRVFGTCGKICGSPGDVFTYNDRLPLRMAVLLFSKKHSMRRDNRLRLSRSSPSGSTVA